MEGVHDANDDPVFFFLFIIIILSACSFIVHREKVQTLLSLLASDIYQHCWY